MIKEVFRFAHTSPEKFCNNWSYQSATLIKCPSTKVWLVANQTLGASWSNVAHSRLGSKPESKKSSTPIGILRSKRGPVTPLNNHHFTLLGSFCWQTQAIKNPTSYLDVCKA